MGYDMRWQEDADHDKAHFHLNGHGMSAYTLAMHELGMVHEAEAVGNYPKSQHPARGIPSFKFGTNDSWWVTPDEIRSALDAYRAVDEERREVVLAGVRQPWNPGYWDEWVVFLEGAVEHGGFRVR